MVIIADFGKQWIESVDVVIPFVALDTPTNSPVVNFTRPGVYIGGVLELQSLGTIDKSIEWTFLDQGGGGISYGEFLTGVIGRGVQRLGATANANMTGIFFLRKP